MHPTFRFKGKVVHVPAMKLYREIRSIAWHWVGMSGELHTPAALPPRKEPTVPIP